MKIIERTQKDIENETKELFEQCKPYLDKGYGFYRAVSTVKGLPNTNNFGNQAWYKRFRDYAVSQGYKPLR